MATEEDFKAQRRELMRPSRLTWAALVLMFGSVILLYTLPDDAARSAILLVLIVIGMALYLFDRIRHFRRVRARWASEDARLHDGPPTA